MDLSTKIFDAEIINNALKIEDTLIISDLHFGYETSLNNQGLMIPQYQFDRVLSSLENIQKKANAKNIILNGDIKHNFGSISKQEWKEVQQIIKTRSSTQARSHAQKFFLRVKKVIKNNGGSFNINEKDKIIECIVVNFLPDRKEQPLTKSQKEKLLSAVSSNIKYEGELNERSDEDFQKVIEEDNLKYRKTSNNDLGNKNQKNNIDQNYADVNNDIFNQRKNTQNKTINKFLSC